MAKQVIDIRPGKGFTTAQSNEHQRRWSDKAWSEAQQKGNYDRTRARLNFEVTKGGKIQSIDTRYSIPEKIAKNLADRGIKDRNASCGGEPKYRTVVNMILGGSRDRMRELAFGTQNVNFEKGKDNSSVERCRDIEEWAKDSYKFIADKFGEENIVAFYVHLDEMNPHVHCTILPVVDGKLNFKKLVDGQDIFSFRRFTSNLHDEYAKVNEKWGLDRGNSIVETKAKHRSTEEYKRELSRECSSSEEEIAELRKESQELWKEISMTTRKIKGLSTMVENLENRKAEIKKETEILLQNKNDAELESQRKLDMLKQELALVNSKIEDKNAKLSEAEKALEKLNADKQNINQQIWVLKQELNNAASEGQNLAMTNVAAAYLDNLVAEFQGLNGEQRESCNRIMNNGLLEELASEGQEMMLCGAMLFLGLSDAAMAYSASHGGGGGGGGSFTVCLFP